MKKYLWIFLSLWLMYIAQAQSHQVDITEISPHKLGDQEEWFEFRVWGDEVNFEHWVMKDSKGRTRFFKDYQDQLLWDDTVTQMSEDNLVFKLHDASAYFAWKKSPISLPNAGGSVELWNKGDLLDTAQYPKLKSGSYRSTPYAEVWTKDPDDGRWYPRLHRTFAGDPNKSSQLKANKPSPVRPENIELVISEISMLNEKDFIELWVKSVKEESSAEYMTVKHNGSVVFEGSKNDVIEADDFILIYPENGLSGGSGTIEVILWDGTSWERWEDVMCYQKGDLSKTEAKRVLKFKTDSAWVSDCADISDFSANVSLARDFEKIDTNSLLDFLPHLKGSPAEPNIHHNEPPKAVITLQNTDQTTRKIPFSVNLTGEGSLDPDGSDDIVKYEWFVNGESFSDRENPTYYKIESTGTYEFSLVVQDLSGRSDRATLMIYGVDKKPKVKTTVAKEAVSKSKKPSHNDFKADLFFGDFVKLNLNFKTTEAADAISASDYYHQKTARDKLKYWGRLDHVAHNLGHIFLEGY